MHAFDPFGAPSPAANTKQHSMPQRSASTASTQSSSRQPQLQHQQSHPARSASPTYLPSTAGLASHVHAESEKKILALREAEAAQEAALEARRDAEMNVDARLQAWECNKDGSKKNIRNLLSTVHTVLWPNSGWKPLGIADLIDFAGIKKAHMKLIRIVSSRLQCSCGFDLLKSL